MLLKLLISWKISDKVSISRKKLTHIIESFYLLKNETFNLLIILLTFWKIPLMISWNSISWSFPMSGQAKKSKKREGIWGKEQTADSKQKTMKMIVLLTSSASLSTNNVRNCNCDLEITTKRWNRPESQTLKRCFENRNLLLFLFDLGICIFHI